MKFNIEYLLRYIDNDTFNKINNKKSEYVLKLAEDNYVDTDLNIKYLIRYGVKNINKVVYDNLEELTMNHNDYINKIKEYEKKLNKEEVIMLLENI